MGVSTFFLARRRTWDSDWGVQLRELPSAKLPSSVNKEEAGNGGRAAWSGDEEAGQGRHCMLEQHPEALALRTYDAAPAASSPEVQLGEVHEVEPKMKYSFFTECPHPSFRPEHTTCISIEPSNRDRVLFRSPK